jgi:predicted P-loop ATPase
MTDLMNAAVAANESVRSRRAFPEHCAIDWVEAERLYNAIGEDELRERGLPEGSGNRDVALNLARALTRTDLLPEQQAAVLHDHARWVSRLKDESKKRTAISKLMNEANDAEGIERAREAATAAGVPVWASCYDKAGLHPRHEVDNVEIALNALGFEARLDVFHDRIIVAYRGEERLLQESVGNLLDDRAETALCTHIRKAFGFDPGDALLHRTILQMATGHAFDPVCEYLNCTQAKWDGVPRLDSWVVTYLGCEDTPLNREIGVRHLIAAVRRARDPGCKYDCILVLEGPEGVQKSTTIETLAGKENFSDQTILGVSDKEVQELLRGVWHFECADLSGMRRAEVERVKAFASRTTDRARRAYGRVREEQPRRCVIWASTNDQSYLKSQTGNRRFLPLLVRHIDIEALKGDRDQLWAEAATREAAGESIVLDRSLWAAANEAQEQRRERDPWEDCLRDIPACYIDTHNGKQSVSSSVLLERILLIEPGKQTTEHGRRLHRVMDKVGGWQRTKRGFVAYRDPMQAERAAREGLRPRPRVEVRGFWREAREEAA